jgi:hypothetical protein
MYLLFNLLFNVLKFTKMKKIFLVLFAVTVMGIFNVSAQTVWGLRVGLSRPTATVSGNGSIEGNFGLEIGPTLYYSLKDNFYLNSGAMFSVKSFSVEDASLSMYYLNIPLYAGIAFPVGSSSFYAQAGPYIGLKLSESEESGLSSFDAGLGIMGGINLEKFKVELGYQYGLVNVANGGDGSTANVTLGSLFIGVSYIF